MDRISLSFPLPSCWSTCWCFIVPAAAYAPLRWFDSYTVGGKNAPLVNDTKVIEFRRLNEANRC